MGPDKSLNEPFFNLFNLFIHNRANSVKDFSTVSTSKNWFCAPRVNETRICASFSVQKLSGFV